MNHRERVLCALRHEQPDLCPWEIGLTQPVAERLREHWGVEDLDPLLGNHLAAVAPEPPDYWAEVRPGYWQDEWGVLWNRTVDRDIGNPEGLIFPRPELDDHEWPDPHDPRRWAHVPGFLAAHPDRCRVVSLGFSLFERAWTMRGMANLLMDMVEHPQFVDDLLDRICDFNVAMVRRAVQYDVDLIHFGDDWGQQQGMIMGPRLWRRFLKPRLQRQYEAARQGGKLVSIHSCGDVQEVLPDLIELGLSLFNPFQPEVMDVYEMKRQYGRDLAFWGGVSTQHTLPYGTPEEVRAEARRLMAEIGAGGGYLIAPAHATPKDVPLENLLALLETVQNQ